MYELSVPVEHIRACAGSDDLFPDSRHLGGQLLTFWRHDTTRTVDVINGCFWLLRRTAVDEVGLLDERFLMYGEDIDWCRRFNASGWKVAFYPRAGALHYGGASSARAPVRFYVEMQRATYQYWQKHHSRASSAAFLLINILHHVVRLCGEILAYPVMRQRRAVAGHNIARACASIRWATRALSSIASRPQPTVAEPRSAS